MNPFTEKAINIIKSIPEGKIMTYGQIAAEAGSPRGARQVVRILHSMSEKHQLPWHRVVSAKGEIAIKDEETHYLQITLLKQEGIAVDENHRIDVEQYRYDFI
ncbi:MGMT family protein [Niallia endozanthoxylica]|uniref:DNA methyltransferase n=1 Tax=Niallia endozanthoxylica TaxID=2036016 RepID=A0A5J5I453_9BACI|nr:MGMT family protein [Niallia endozanthoxylica]KAA9028434.1 DNA methyltransferase [Niallia endozanthoxylica]